MRTGKYALLALCLCISSLLPATAEATAPKKVVLQYDPGVQTLSVTIEHPVWSWLRFSHHIRTVEIKLNGNSNSINQYDTQPGDLFTYTYKIPAAPGDVLEATARCSYWGSKTASITVAKPGGP
jgi:hypothetical protein